MTIQEAITILDQTFHPEYQEDYDNSGFLLGDTATPLRGILVALDLTPAVIDEAVELGDVNLIVTHHPFIFRGVKRLTDGSETGRMVMSLIKNDIAVYAAHTNLDNLPWGVSAALAEQLGLQHCRILHENKEDIGAGMVGELPEPMPLRPFLQKVKTVTGIPFVRHSSNQAFKQSNIRKVALCGGSGSEFIGDAIAVQADIYLTADLKYHDFQRSTDRMVLADIGHYESEQFAKDVIYRALLKKFSNFALRISERQHSIVRYI